MTAPAVTIDPRSAPAVVADFLARVRPPIDAALEGCLAWPHAAGDPAARLGEAMRYAVLGPGKRLRPALTVAACEAAGGTLEGALPAACAIELCHAYTLVHDDLPAMDDDDERRGRPAVHKAFDEATAILAGDGLLTAAFASLARLGPRAGDGVRVLANRAGAGELLAGQARDLASAADTGASAGDLAAVEVIAAAKTGALFAAATELGGIAAGADDRGCASLARYGMAIGIAFQHADDRDDDEHTDHAAAAAVRIAELCQKAAAIAATFTGGAVLSAIATWIGAAGGDSPAPPTVARAR